MSSSERKASQNLPCGGLLLAGGQSSRMGECKAELSFRGETLQQRAINLMERMNLEPALISGGAAGLKDPVPQAGPVAGICALGRYIAAQGGPKKWLILPIDMPLLSEETLATLRDIPASGAYFVSHPLPAMLDFKGDIWAYLAAAERDLAARRGVSVRRLLSAIGAAAVMPSAAQAETLVNVNTPEEWQALLAADKADICCGAKH